MGVGLCRARMSLAGLSFETATRRGEVGCLFVREEAEYAEEMRDRIEARFVDSVEARAGEIVRGIGSSAGLAVPDGGAVD